MDPLASSAKYAAWPSGSTVITAIELISLPINSFNDLGSAPKSLGTDLFRPRCFLLCSLHQFYYLFPTLSFSYTSSLRGTNTFLTAYLRMSHKLYVSCMSNKLCATEKRARHDKPKSFSFSHLQGVVMLPISSQKLYFQNSNDGRLMLWKYVGRLAFLSLLTSLWLSFIPHHRRNDVLAPFRAGR